MNDMAIQVGEAKAGKRLSTKIAINSRTVTFAISVNSITASINLFPGKIIALITFERANRDRRFHHAKRNGTTIGAS